MISSLIDHFIEAHCRIVDIRQIKTKELEKNLKRKKSCGQNIYP